jgi:hypothetical protein
MGRDDDLVRTVDPDCVLDREERVGVEDLAVSFDPHLP